jgi:tripartite-type tricarboxylate transporter receptor subunit TctC
MTRRTIAAIGGVIALGTALTACSAGGDDADAAVSFPDHEIHLVIPYSAGGGNDTMARLVASHMEDNLPGKVSIIPENVPGGDSNIGLSQVYNASPDGYTIGIAALPGNFVNQVLGTANYDLTDVEYIGYEANSSYMAVASKASGITSLDDVLAKGDLLAGVASISSTDGLGMLIAADTLGFTVRPVAHDGCNEATLSAIRGDVDIVQCPYEGMKSVVQAGEAVPLWIYAEERDPDLPDVPTIVELGHPELLDSISLHRVMFAPPGTPQEIMDILREAFDQAVNSDEFKSGLETAGIPWNPDDWEQAQAAADESLPQIEKFEDVLKGN